MTWQKSRELALKRMKKINQLIDTFETIPHPTQNEKDLFCLQTLRYEIDPYSSRGRAGYIGALDRAIKKLKEVE